jgi:FMN phosphatase YigB (HAD superfamily)
MSKKITKLSIFDFDGTLVNTPLPDTGKQQYHDKTGKVWPHEGWWGRHESLDLNVFEMPTLEEVIVDYEKAKTEDSTAVILLTGRMIKLSDHVKVILDAKGLKFDEYHFNRGGATEDAKKKSMERLLEKYNDVTEMELWDDRLAHIPIFEDFLQKLVEGGRITNFKINVVNGSHH